MVDFFETVLHSTTSTYIIRLDFAQNTASFMCSALLHLSLEIETKRVLGENLLYYFYCSTPLYEILMMLSRFEAPLYQPQPRTTSSEAAAAPLAASKDSLFF